MIRVVVAGYGAVGQAVAHVLTKHSGVDVLIDDPAKGLNYYRDEYIDPPDAVVVCVATPMRDNGSCNTDHVEEVFEKYGNVKYLIKPFKSYIVIYLIHLVEECNLSR